MLTRLARSFASKGMDLSSMQRLESLPSLISKTYQSAFGIPSIFPSDLITENKHLLFTDSAAKIITQNGIQVPFPLTKSNIDVDSSQSVVLLHYNINQQKPSQSIMTRNLLIHFYRLIRI